MKNNIFCVSKKVRPKKITSLFLSDCASHDSLISHSYPNIFHIHDSCKWYWARNAGCQCIGEREYKALKFFFLILSSTVLTLKLDNFFCFVFYTRKKSTKQIINWRKVNVNGRVLFYLIPFFNVIRRSVKSKIK